LLLKLDLTSFKHPNIFTEKDGWPWLEISKRSSKLLFVFLGFYVEGRMGGFGLKWRICPPEGGLMVTLA
jgi:hypothetical protein